MSRLDVLFVHTNFPAQFRGLADHLCALPNVRVRAICAGRGGGPVGGIDVQHYGVTEASPLTVHPFARRFDQECRRAEQVMYAANALKLQGFDPQLVYVHPGWGEALPLRILFPQAVIVAYAEFYYRANGADVGFDQEFGQLGVDGQTRVTLRNAANLLALADADLAIAPTQWQRSVFPSEFHGKIQVVHDGIDTEGLSPSPGGQAGGEEILTYAARNLEPYRGFHVFMRSLPSVLRARPKAQVYIVGGDGVSYGNPPRSHPTWREAMLAELGGQLDASRVHFTGPLAREAYLALLRRSRAHVYLTYPFVLSWSALEAMSLGCLMVGSDTAPVTEVIEHEANGYIVPFGQPQAIAERLIEALSDASGAKRLREAARDTVVSRYDLKRVSLPRHDALIANHLGRRLRPTAEIVRRNPLLHQALRDAVAAGSA